MISKIILNMSMLGVLISTLGVYGAEIADAYDFLHRRPAPGVLSIAEGFKLEGTRLVPGAFTMGGLVGFPPGPEADFIIRKLGPISLQEYAIAINFISRYPTLRDKCNIEEIISIIRTILDIPAADHDAIIRTIEKYNFMERAHALIGNDREAYARETTQMFESLRRIRAENRDATIDFIEKRGLITKIPPDFDYEHVIQWPLIEAFSDIPAADCDTLLGTLESHVIWKNAAWKDPAEREGKGVLTSRHQGVLIRAVAKVPVAERVAFLDAINVESFHTLLSELQLNGHYVHECGRFDGSHIDIFTRIPAGRHADVLALIETHELHSAVISDERLLEALGAITTPEERAARADRVGKMAKKFRRLESSGYYHTDYHAYKDYLLLLLKIPSSGALNAAAGRPQRAEKRPREEIVD